MRKRSESVESPSTYVTEWVSRGHFYLAVFSFGPPSRALVVITWRRAGCRYMTRLGKTVERAQLLNIKEQMSSIWARGCMLMIVCVLSDLTWLPLLRGGRKSWNIIYSNKVWSLTFACSLKHCSDKQSCISNKISAMWSCAIWYNTHNKKVNDVKEYKTCTLKIKHVFIRVSYNYVHCHHFKHHNIFHVTIYVIQIYRYATWALNTDPRI